MKLYLTDAHLRTLQPCAELDGQEHWDDAPGIPNLHLIVTKTALTWKVRYRVKGTTTQRRPKLGTYPEMKLTEARIAAKAYLDRVGLGDDPAAEQAAAEEKIKQDNREKVKPSYTVSHLIAAYVADATKRGKVSVKDEENTFKREVTPRWGDWAPAEVTKRHIAEALLEIKQRAPVGANRTRAAMMALFKFAVEQLILETSPVDGVKVPTKENHDEVGRVMNDGELRVVLKAIDASDLERTTKGALLFLALTGQRPIEGCGLMISELSYLDKPDKAQAEFPAERYRKGRRSHIVPFAPQVVDLVQSMIEMQEAEEFIPVDENDTGEITHVFASRYADRGGVSPGSLPQAMRRLIEEMKVEGPDASIIRGLKADRPTPHSFRRTVATGMGNLGEEDEDKEIPDEIISMALGHKIQTVTRTHYNKSAKLRQRRVALTKWADHVTSLLTGEVSDGRVIAMRRRKAA